MTHVQGVSKRISEHVLRTLTGKICNEMNKIFEERGDELYSAILEPTFANPSENKPFQTGIIDIYVDEVTEKMKPSSDVLYQAKMTEGFINGIRKSQPTVTPKQQQMIIELSKTQKELYKQRRTNKFNERKNMTRKMLGLQTTEEIKQELLERLNKINSSPNTSTQNKATIDNVLKKIKNMSKEKRAVLMKILNFSIKILKQSDQTTVRTILSNIIQLVS
jgi:hypothetical protein